MMSIGERQIIMGCKKANMYVIRSDQAMTCCNMKAFTGKKPLLKSDEDWQCTDTPIVKRESDEPATRSCSSIGRLKFINTLSHLQDILQSNEASNQANIPSWPLTTTISFVFWGVFVVCG